MTDRDPGGSRADDEALSALMDGALSDEEARSLRERLARDPALAARLTALERTEESVRDSYAGIVDEPLPGAVLDLLEGADHADNVVPLRTWPQPHIAWIPSAIAAGIALAVGLTIGVSLDTSIGGLEDLDFAGGGAIAPASVLHEVLESVPSGETRGLAAELAATPRFTFKALDGGYCRQVGFSSAGRQAETLACRKQGVWHVGVVVFAAEESPPAAGEVYRPASRAAGPLDAAVDALIDGSPLGAELESRVMESGWTEALE
jgi:anti-sigma factor RsiW